MISLIELNFVVLRAVENIYMRNTREDEIVKAIKTAEDKYLPLHSNESSSSFPLLEERRRDQASHFILRLAFCNNSESIRWFVTQECALFKARFSHELVKDRMDFLKYSNSYLAPISSSEKEQVTEQLRKCSPGKESDEFYKVPFEFVPELVSRRTVFLKGGWAFVPKSESFSLIMTKFRENLEFWMERTAREIPTLRDERLLPLLQLVKTTDNSATDATRGVVDGKLTADTLDAASTHFPLCMYQLYTSGKLDNHLKHGGRQQLGLFLKGIGLPLEEALIFWRRLFVPKSGEDGFNKNYAYNVRHNYGMEGKRANYGPTPCSKIIMGPQPGAGDCHGCPYRHSSPEQLSISLNMYTAPSGKKLELHQVTEIVDMARSNQCQGACTRLFEYTRKPDVPPGHMETFSFPTKFFEASINLTKKSSQ